MNSTASPSRPAGRKWAVSILGSSIGEAQIPETDKYTAVVIAGNSKLDLSKITTDRDQLVIDLVVMAGSVVISVPQSLSVEQTGFMIVGSRRSVDQGVNTQAKQGNLTINCLGLFGSVNIKYV